MIKLFFSRVHCSNLRFRASGPEIKSRIHAFPFPRIGASSRRSRFPKIPFAHRPLRPVAPEKRQARSRGNLYTAARDTMYKNSGVWRNDYKNTTLACSVSSMTSEKGPPRVATFRFVSFFKSIPRIIIRIPAARELDGNATIKARGGSISSSTKSLSRD